MWLKIRMCVQIMQFHGGVICLNFGYGRAAGVPEPHRIHILGQVKNMTHSYTFHIENWPYSYTIFQIVPILILFGWKRV